MSSADDELVWSIPSGSVLMCAQDLVMEGTGEVAYTAGRSCQGRVDAPNCRSPFREDAG